MTGATGEGRAGRVYPVRYDEVQYDGLERAARRFSVTGRQKAQKRINQLYMAFFGIIRDPVSAAVFGEMVAKRLKERARRARRKDAGE